jgi:sensor domain CHASE-containing protein
MNPETLLLLSLLTGAATLMTAVIGVVVAGIKLRQVRSSVKDLREGVQEVHLSVNSELAALKKLIASEAFAAGVRKGANDANAD